MTGTRLCLEVNDWPEIDRERWRSAQAPAGFLEDDKPASYWTSARRRIVEQAYGQWLGFLERNGELDPAAAPGERATPDCLTAFVNGLRDRVAPVSAAMMVGALQRMLTALEPEQDWTALGRVYNHLKQTAAPVRDKLSTMVPASELLDLGIALMETCDRGLTAIYKATRYRDGLIIALLISCPMRLKNLAALVVGQHLVSDGHDYRVRLAATETKTGRPYVAAVPAELTTYIDRWLQVYRPVPLMAAATRATAKIEKHLWVDRNGRPMSSRAIHAQITLRTRQAFGNAIWPHLFRDCAVTELVDCAPEEIGIAPDLLGHAALGTTRKHYIQAQGMTAHRRVQETIAARRRAARRTPGG